MHELTADRTSACYRAACVQAAPVAFDLPRTLEKVRDLAADAARDGSKLILFPEAFISAYPRGAGFGTVIGVRSEAGSIVNRLLLCLTPQPHGVEITPLVARPAGNAVVDAILLRGGRWLFTAFLGRDLVPLADMDLRIEGALAGGGPLGFAARWLLTIPASSVATDRPDDPEARGVQRMGALSDRAESQV